MTLFIRRSMEVGRPLPRRRSTSNGPQTSSRGRRWLAAVACHLTSVLWSLSLFAAPVAAQPTWTQTFDLVPGWNAIYVHVQPQDTDPALVFDGLSVRTVWTRGVEPAAAQFIQDPAEGLQRQRGWLAYVPADREESLGSRLADNRLVSIQGNRAYLIELAGGPATLSITGRPLVPFINWQANAFNLLGFPVDPAVPPTFAAYFAPSPAHAGQPVYRLLASGEWERVAAPTADTMSYGEAYWVFSGTGSDFVAPLDVDVPTSAGLSYGRDVGKYRLTFNNLSANAVTISVRDLESPDAVPLSYWRVNTDPGPDLGEFQWLELDGDLDLPATAGGSRSARLAVRRGDFTAEEMASVLSLRDGQGTRWLLPLEARSVPSRRGDTGNGGSVFTGLWFGQASVNKVSEPQRGSLLPVPTTGTADSCPGGPNAGMPCTEAADCPGRCTRTCEGGSNQGMACTVATEATDCAGSTCVGQPLVCAGGVNVGLACDAPEDCPGSTCEAMGACAGGERAGRPCTVATQADDCPSSICNQGSRCDGGINADLPCSGPADCGFACDEVGGGSEFPMRLLIHVDSAGNARLLKQVIQMWQNGTTKPDPDDRSVRIEDTPGRYVLLTDDALIPSFQGGSLRDGVPVGKRASTAHYDFPGDELDMTGDFGGTNTLSATIVLAPDFPTNPYRHPFHPDHDNLNAMGEPKDEAFAITREIDLEFTSTDPTGVSSPDFGFDTVAGRYREEISGLHRNPIRVEGTFRLERAVTTPELNQ